MKNYYKILEISGDASTEVIKAAYKAMSKKYHPDLYAGDKAQADAKMQDINEAYEVLSDSSLKAEYDKTLNSSNNTEKSDISDNENRTSSSIKPQSTSNDNLQSDNSGYFLYQGRKISCGGFIIRIIVLAVIIYGVFGWLVPNCNSCVGIKADESSKSTEKLDKEFVEGSPEYVISTFIDTSKSLTIGNIDETEFNEILINYTTKDFLEEFIDFEIDYEKLDWVYELQSLIDYEINKSDFLDKYNDLISNIDYSIANVNIDENEAVLTVNLHYTDFPNLILSTAKDVKSESNRSNNLGIKRDYGELFLEYLNKNTAKYSNTLNDNIDFNLIKQNGYWKISKCNSADTLIKVISINVIKGSSQTANVDSEITAIEKEFHKPIGFTPDENRTVTSIFETVTDAETYYIRDNYSEEYKTFDFEGGHFYCIEYTYYKATTEYKNFTAEIALDECKDAETIINRFLSEIGNAPSEWDIKYSKTPASNISDMSLIKNYNQIQSVFAKDDLLFINVVKFTNQGGGVILASDYNVKTYIFDIQTGNQLSAENIFNDFDAIKQIAVQYANTFIEANIPYEIYSAEPYKERLNNSKWYNESNWEYDGKNFTVHFGQVVYNSHIDDVIEIIPNDVIEPYLKTLTIPISKLVDIIGNNFGNVPDVEVKAALVELLPSERENIINCLKRDIDIAWALNGRDNTSYYDESMFLGTDDTGKYYYKVSRDKKDLVDYYCRYSFTDNFMPSWKAIDVEPA